MWGLWGVFVVFAIVSFFIIPTSGADEGLRWTEIDFADQFQMPPIPGFESEMSPEGATPDLSLETDVGSELARGQRLVIEDLSPLRPDPKSGEEGEEMYKVANIFIELPSGWNAALEGDRYEGNLTLEGPCALVRIGWFEDSGIEPGDVLRQVARAYRSDYLRFSILTAEAGEPVGGQMASSLNVYYMYGGLESQKRIVAWSSPVSGRFFYASFWSCPESFDENLERFELVCESFRDEGSERYVELEPRPVTFDGWGTVLSEILGSRHFAKVAAQQSPEVEVKVSMKSHLEGGQVIQLASEEMVSPTRSGGDPPREGAILKLLQDEGYEVSLLQRGGASWVVVLGPKGRWQAISAAAEAKRGLGTLVGPDEEEWYRGLVVDGPEETAGEEEVGTSAETVIEKDCDPPREAHFDPVAEVNLTWILRLEDLLELYTYSQKEPDLGLFHEAQVCWALLKREGYDALLVTGHEGHPLRQEMWVVVSHPDEGHLAVGPATAGDGSGLGEIVSDAEYFDGVAYETSLQYTCLHPDRGLAIDPGMIRVPAPG